MASKSSHRDASNPGKLPRHAVAGLAAARRAMSGPAPPGDTAMPARLLRRAPERHPLASLRPLIGPALRVATGCPTRADVHLLV
jgi:hypothetical protein